MATRSEDEAPTVTFLDNPHAPEVFSDEAVGVLFHNGNVHITFATPRVNHSKTPGPVNRVVNARLVMPLVGIDALQKMLAGFMERFKTQAPEFMPPGPRTLQ